MTIGSREMGLGRKHVYIVDDNVDVRRGIHASLSAAGFAPRAFASGADFVDAIGDLDAGCVLLDLRMPEIDGLEVLEATTSHRGRLLPIMISAHGDVTTAVRAMQLGAIDFIEKPFTEGMLMRVLEKAFASLSETTSVLERQTVAKERIATLSEREREVLRGLLAGMANKQVAAALDLSPRTVEMHRARMMDHLGAQALPDALRTAFEAGLPPLDGGQIQPTH